jgi:LysR family hydrogen peroxide-inducible transcriptional activator
MFPLLSAFPFSLRQLQYVVAVADHGGFRRAADVCHVSQPSLSAQVSQVERALGMRIFERTRAGVRVAPAATGLVERARGMLVAARDLAENARLHADPFLGTLRLGIVPTVCPYVLPDVAPALARRFPRLTVLWSEERTGLLLKRLDEAALDAAIVAAGDDVAHLEQVRLAEDPFVLAAAPDQPLVHASAPVRPGELRGADVLLLEDGHCFRDQALALCDRVGASEIGFRATSLSTLVQMVSANGGLTLLPSLALPVENRRAQLKVRPFPRGGPSRTIVLAWRRGSALGPALRQVADTIRKTLASIGRNRPTHTNRPANPQR